eukprot:CAMPEP_0202451294 /NCGR_PEP_ID=MMETSP1360-20130828/9760_1 /ASSEMBLY_ACC=CAM_ASM_000848 /TAXON_ID=515479 /ORGANISM="Licmophora paradoxa, Strain CCMP2313" /LENGTH=459 /DNA_ID=CAMNT_0049069831 /DNA_START=85 /DNA_END=1464 /DNA_ORIENTATION=-
MNFVPTSNTMIPRPPKSPSSTKLVITTKQQQQQDAPPKASVISPVSTVQFGKDDVHLEEMKIALEEAEVLQTFMYKALNPPFDPQIILNQNQNQSKISHCRRSTNALPPRVPDQDQNIARPDLISRCQSDPSALPSTSRDAAEKPMISLADDCVRNGDIATGIALYQCVLKEQEKQNRTDPKIATTLHKLGEAHFATGKLELAAGFFQEAVTIRATAHGSLNQSVADSLVHYGASKLGLKQLHEAHDAYRRALRIHQKLHGVNHSNVGHIHTQLGCIHYEMGEFLAANAAFEDALDVYQDLARKTPSDQKLWMGAAADALCSIGSIKLNQKKYDRAICCFKDALSIQRQIYGPYHVSVIASLDNIAYGQSKSKRYSVASQTFEEMLHTQLTYHKFYNLACYETLKKLTFLYEKTDNIQCAYDVTIEAHNIQKRTLSHADPVYLKTKRLLQNLQQKIAQR